MKNSVKQINMIFANLFLTHISENLLDILYRLSSSGHHNHCNSIELHGFLPHHQNVMDRHSEIKKFELSL